MNVPAAARKLDTRKKNSERDYHNVTSPQHDIASTPMVDLRVISDYEV